MSQLDDLEARVAALEAAARTPAASTLQPNVLTISPTGAIGANFTGHVSAQGVDLTAAPGETWPPPINNCVRWLRQSDNAVIAELYGDTPDSQTDNVLLGATTPEPGSSSLVSLSVYDDRPYEQARLNVGQYGRGTTAYVAAHLAQANLYRYIIRQDAASDFLQLLSTQKLQLAFGTAVSTWSGGIPFSNPLAIPHGLGRTPVAYIAMANGTTSATNLNYMVGGTNAGAGQSVSVDANNLYVRAWSWQGNPNNGETGNILWAAIG